MEEPEKIIAELVSFIEDALGELISDMRECGMTDFGQGEGYGYIICLERLKDLLPKSDTLLNYNIEEKYEYLI